MMAGYMARVSARVYGILPACYAGISPLPRFEAGEGGRRSVSEGGRVRAAQATTLAKPSPPIASRWVPPSRFEARERES